MEQQPARGAEEEAAPVRKIIHIDMDAFYASVEQRDDPSLRGRPIAVGGSHERGVVAAASYEARVFGVRSAMPSVTARRLCPDLVFVRPRFEVYRAISEEIRAIFARHTALIEPVALDEAYLDVTENLSGLPTATDVARAIRAEIQAQTGLVASAGVSYNKFLAKVASDFKKPNALFVITPMMGSRFVEDLPIGRFHGVGPVTETRMKRLGILTGRDLKARSLEELQAAFGSAAAYYHAVVRGTDERPLRAHRIRKSVGAENTFSDDADTYPVLAERLAPILAKVWSACEVKGVQGRTVTLKVKFSDFVQITRARSLPEPVANLGNLYARGRGVAQDYAAARGWVEKAAAAGNTYAMSSLAILYIQGQGVAQDYGAARGWFEKAAAKGDPGAMFNLGLLYAEGQGVPQDYAAAKDWYEKAAAAGDTDAMNNLAGLYADGQGVEQDYRAAIGWWEKAAAAGDTDAMVNLASLYTMAEDHRSARAWYEKAAAKGNSEAQAALAKLKAVRR